MSGIGGVYDIDPAGVRGTLNAVGEKGGHLLAKYEELCLPVADAAEGTGGSLVLVEALAQVVDSIAVGGDRLRERLQRAMTGVTSATQAYSFGDEVMAQDTTQAAVASTGVLPAAFPGQPLTPGGR